MRTFKSFHVKGDSSFRDQEFDLNQKGISVILGKNGAGKSRLFSLIPEAIYGNPIIGTKRDVARSGSQQVNFSLGEHDYSLLREFASRKESLTVTRDGKDLGFRELKDARHFIVEKLGWSDQEFQTLVYLDCTIPHVLVSGDTAVRRSFFTKFFRLDSVTEMQKLVSAELKDAGRASIQIREVNASIDELQESTLDREGILKKKAVLDRLSEKKRALAESIEESTRIAKLADLKKTNEYKNLSSLLKGDFSSFDDYRTKVTASIKKTREKLQQAQEYAAYLKNARTFKAKLKQHEEQVAELLGDVSLKEARKRLAQIQQLEDSENSLTRSINTQTKILAGDTAGLRFLKKEAKDAEDELEDAKSNSSCPTCGEPLKNHATILASLKKNLTKKRSVLIDVEDQIQQRTEYLAKIESKREDLQQQMQELKPLRKALDLYDNPPVLEEFDGPELEAEPIQERLDELLESRAFLNSCSTLVDSFIKASNLTKKELALVEGSASTEDLIALSDKVTRLELEVDGHKERYLRLKDLRKRQEGLQKNLDKLEALKVMEGAFSRKGLQQMMIKLICSQLEQVVNKYARLLFPEDYHFEFDLSTQFNIFVTRSYGKRKEVSDVRKLSGAERRIFNFVLLIGLLKFVPKSKRSNFLVLDEPTSNFGPEFSEAFCKFLPILNKVIPHIIVITPKADDVKSIENAKIFTVVKKRGISTLTLTT